MSRFFCDSNCELDYTVFDTLNIDLIRMPYTVNGEEEAYDLGRSGKNKGFFDKMRAGAAVKTQALNQTDYINYFEPVLSNGEDIIYVTFTHKMSATFESMYKAIDELKEKYPERTVTVADSKGISAGAAIVVYYAALLHNEGKSDAEVKDFVENFRTKLSLYFTVNDLVYLKRGGRLSSFKAMMGTILNLKPIIELNNGALISTERAKGRKKAIHFLADKLVSDNVDTSYYIFAANADSKADAEELCGLIKQRYPEANILTHEVGPVIGCHCGPDCLGIAFIKKP